MILATKDDVEKFTGDLNDGETTRLPGLLEEASDLVEGYCGREFAEPVPGPVTRRVARIVARALGVDDEQIGMESSQMSAGPFQRTQNYSADSTSGGAWLTKGDKLVLRRYRRGVVNVAMY
ncbi:hypothetical protein [Rhodococcoides fascians]|uniref:hypothetical protein n=1 Tax=Rhodococcoides fascians TaxID=1828 RepID=UPI00050CE555|nr:hypothetical protein [Rhodococcus fascians]